MVSEGGDSALLLLISVNCHSRGIAMEWASHMDAKILKKHQQLKTAAESNEKQEASSSRHVPGQGFSEESEKFFTGLATKKREALQNQLLQDGKSEPSQTPRPDHELDSVTLQLRREFALLNRISELRQIAHDSSSKKLSRKASGTAIKEAKKAGNRAKTPKAVLQSETAKPPTKEPKSKWIRRACWRCNSRFSIHADWERPPSLCPVCSKDINETYLPSAPDRSKSVGWVRIVSGGAPGLGKRR